MRTPVATDCTSSNSVASALRQHLAKYMTVRLTRAPSAKLKHASNIGEGHRQLFRAGDIRVAQYVWEKRMFPNFNKSGAQLNGASVSPSKAPTIGVPAGDRVISIIGPDLTIDGDLISRGELRVDGEVQGNIEGTRVVIGEHAQITGGVSAEDVIVLGHVMGTVRGLRVSLQSTCHVEGDVYHQALVMEQGASFEGKSSRSNDPMTIAAVPELSGPNGTIAP